MAITTSATSTLATVSATVDDPSTASTLIWRFEASGWTAQEAGNLVAFANGLRPVSAGWTVREIGHLGVLRSLVQAARIHS